MWNEIEQCESVSACRCLVFKMPWKYQYQTLVWNLNFSRMEKVFSSVNCTYILMSTMWHWYVYIFFSVVFVIVDVLVCISFAQLCYIRCKNSFIDMVCRCQCNVCRKMNSVLSSSFVLMLHIRLCMRQKYVAAYHRIQLTRISSMSFHCMYCCP